MHCTCLQSMEHNEQGPYHHNLFIGHALCLEELTDRDHVLLHTQLPGLHHSIEYRMSKFDSVPMLASRQSWQISAVHTELYATKHSH